MVRQKTIRLDSTRLEQFMGEILIKGGLREKDAATVAGALIMADLRGIDTHGCVRLPIYMKRIKLGVVNDRPNIHVFNERLNTALVDNDYGLGQIGSCYAMKLAIEKSKTAGISVVGVRHSHHFGAAAYYAMMALKEDMISFVCTNTCPLMPATGGAQSAVGNNPFAFAIPAGRETPIVLDMACSVVAQGKIIMLGKQGKPIPENWALDSEGRPTTNAAEAIKGFILPMGGPKGYGLAVVMDALSGVLMGSDYGLGVTSVFKDLDKRQNSAHTFVALNISAFMEVKEFKSRMDQMIADIKAGRRAEGVNEIFLPGEIENNKKIKYSAEGIPLSEAVYNDIMALGAEYGVKL